MQTAKTALELHYGSQSGTRKSDEHGRQTSLVGSLGDVADQTKAVYGNFASALEKSVREKPTGTLIVAACVGFALGAIWKA